MKSKRQSIICEIIEQMEIETQEELVAALEMRGLKVTQATVSRDIRELHLTKVVGKSGINRYAMPKQDNKEQAPLVARKFSRVLQEAFISADAAGNLVVVKTMTGMGSAVGAALDSMHMEEVVGTIAGDDTIFMAVRSEKEARELLEKIREMIS